MWTRRFIPLGAMLSGVVVAAACGEGGRERDSESAMAAAHESEDDSSAPGGSRPNGIGGEAPVRAILESSEAATQCPQGRLGCEGGCVDPLSDGVFCGASGNCKGESRGDICSSSELCIDGACELACTAPQIDCGGGCIDPSKDGEFCGASGTCEEDEAGTSCGDGACYSGECGCGEAGAICESGQVCLSDTCQVPGWSSPVQLDVQPSGEVSWTVSSWDVNNLNDLSLGAEGDTAVAFMMTERDWRSSWLGMRGLGGEWVTPVLLEQKNTVGTSRLRVGVDEDGGVRAAFFYNYNVNDSLQSLDCDARVGTCKPSRWMASGPTSDMRLCSSPGGTSTLFARHKSSVYGFYRYSSEHAWLNGDFGLAGKDALALSCLSDGSAVGLIEVNGASPGRVMGVSFDAVHREFESPIDVAHSDTVSFNTPVMSVNQDQVVALFEAADGGYWWASRAADTGAWTTPVPLGGAEGLRVKHAVLPSGGLLFVTGEEEATEAQMSFRVGEGATSGDLGVTGEPITWYRVASTGQGAVVAWVQEPSAGGMRLQASFYHEERANWSMPETIVERSDGSFADAILLRANERGNAALAWLHELDGEKDVWATTFTPDPSNF